MRKTRLVLIPGVKSLDTIGCLLLFLACPTIAFKGQENREVDTICKAQNLKEFWVDSPWPGDADNIGWVRGYGGGTWPGNSQEQNTCNGLPTRSVVRSRRSDDRRVQARREVSRDDGIERRKTRMENDMRRDTRREMIRRRTDSRNIRDARRVGDRIVSDEERRMESRRVSENRADSRASRSSDREIRSIREVRELDSRSDSFARDRSVVRVRSNEQRSVTIREQIDVRRNSRASRNVDREIRFKREVSEAENRRAVINQESTDATMTADRRNIQNREVIDGRRDSRVPVRSQDSRSVRKIRNLASRAAITLEKADSRITDERVRSFGRQRADSRRANERINSRLAARSLEREIRSDKDARELVYQRDSQSRTNQRMPGERMRAAEMRVMNSRDVVNTRTDNAFQIRSLDRGFRSERDFRTESKRTVLAHERTHSGEVDERRSDERQNVDGRRASIGRRDSSLQNQRKSIRSERKVREIESHIHDRMGLNERVRTDERRTISNREVIDGRRLSVQSLDRQLRYNREVRQPEGRRSARFQRSTNMRLHEENHIENTLRRDSRLSTRSLDRQIRYDRETLEVEHRRNLESDSRRIENFRSSDERMIDSRTVRENIRVSRQSIRSIEREARLLDAQRAVRYLVNDMRNPKESTLTYQRRAALDTRESTKTTANIRSEEHRRTDSQRERDSRLPRSVEYIRSAEERRVDSRRLKMERRDSRLPTRSQEREVPELHAGIREAKILHIDAARSNNLHTADSRRNSRLSFRGRDVRRSLPGLAIFNRESGVERETRTVRETPERVSRRVVDIEGADVRLVRDEWRSSVRLQQSARSLEDVRQYDLPVQRVNSRRDSIRRHESRREVEREITREGRNFDRFTSGADRKRSELGQVRDQYSRSQRLQGLSRFSDGIRLSDRRIQLARAERDTRRLDMHRTEGEREIRLIDSANPERNSRRVAGAERGNTNLERDDSRSQLLTTRIQREVRSVGGITRSDRQTRRADIRRENMILDNRRNEIGRETKTIVRAPERLSRLAADAERVDTNPVRDDTRSQTRLREARSIDVRRFDRRMAQTQRETTQSDSEHRVETLRHLDRATPERIIRQLASTEVSERLTRDSRSQRFTHQREIRFVNERRAGTERESRQERREVDHLNRQRRFIPADFRQINKRDSRDTKIRRISQDASSLKTKSISTFFEEARRSDRQRRVVKDSSRFMDKRHENTLTAEPIQRFAELSELTNKPRRSLDTREMYAGKTNTMEVEYGQELSDAGKNNFFESSKNALASWLTTDISRTDLNGIAETLMYGGIACFALFSNVNKKVIF